MRWILTDIVCKMAPINIWQLAGEERCFCLQVKCEGVNYDQLDSSPVSERRTGTKQGREVHYSSYLHCWLPLTVGGGPVEVWVEVTGGH